MPKAEGKVFKLNWAAHNPNKHINLNEPEYSIYVADLDCSVTDKELFDLFNQKYTGLLSAKIILDPSTKMSKGYGFVKFTEKSQMEKALKEMNGKLFKGRNIRTNVAAYKRAKYYSENNKQNSQKSSQNCNQKNQNSFNKHNTSNSNSSNSTKGNQTTDENISENKDDFKSKNGALKKQNLTINVNENFNSYNYYGGQVVNRMNSNGMYNNNISSITNNYFNFYQSSFFYHPIQNNGKNFIPNSVKVNKKITYFPEKSPSASIKSSEDLKNSHDSDIDFLNENDENKFGGGINFVGEDVYENSYEKFKYLNDDILRGSLGKRSDSNNNYSENDNDCSYFNENDTLNLNEKFIENIIDLLSDNKNDE